MSRTLAVVVLALGISGCSLVESGPEVLPFEPLLDSATFVQQSGFGPSVVLQSAADEAEFQRFYGAGSFPEEVDYSRRTVVGVVFPASEPGGRVSIRGASVDGDQLAFVVDASGSFTRPDSAAAVAFPASFVTVPRIRQAIRVATYEYVGDGD